MKLSRSVARPYCKKNLFKKTHYFYCLARVIGVSKMKYLKLLTTLFFIYVGINYPQENKPQFQVDFNEINGELTSKDLYKKDFGRYDGYEIELYEGEAINFVVYTKNFQPGLALVNSNGEVFQQSSRNDKGYANIFTIVPKSGNWVLYVIGDQSSRGSYTLQSAIAEPNSLSLNKDADFCTTLNFLLAHSNAYFFLLENNLSGKQLVKLNGAVDSYLDEESGSYDAVFNDGNEKDKAENEVKNIWTKIKSCVNINWKEKDSDWQKVGDYKEKKMIFTEQVEDKARIISATIQDNENTKQKNKNRFSVFVEIKRER